MHAFARCFAPTLFALVLAACAGGPPISDVSVAPSVISPNADGHDDLTQINYKINAQSRVSIYLTDAQGKRFDVRRDIDRPASPKPYSLLFNGIAEGRMMPNGDYTWHIDALAADGRTTSAQGKLTIQDADVTFPKIIEFTASTGTFTPNRDAIEDHVYINVVTSKDAKLHVYVIGPNGFRYDVPRQEGTVILSIDVSGSMLADDLQPNRMEAAKNAAISFVQVEPLGVLTLRWTAGHWTDDQLANLGADYE